MRGAEGIVHINITQRGVGLAELGIVFLLAFVHTHVLQHHHFAGLRARRVLPPIAAHGHGEAEQAAQMRGHGCEVVFGLEFALGGTAEVAHQDNGRAVIQAVAHRGERGADAGVVADFAVFNRHVQVGTDQHGFTAHILFGELKEGHGYLFWFQLFGWENRAAVPAAQNAAIIL